MDTFRIPKAPAGSAIARLTLASATYGRGVTASLAIERTMQSTVSTASYDSVEEAEERSIAAARQQGAAIIVIDDRT
ncbi:hypothetical protein [Sphingomonas kyungheensis]|uniref:Uncharacterized protein n=1 Tax=Sphingomonas kyungheensis TaxID=1069987 RepID=A0ABU8H692_9SPHN